jgi:hypothetical protein
MVTRKIYHGQAGEPVGILSSFLPKEKATGYIFSLRFLVYGLPFQEVPVLEMVAVLRQGPEPRLSGRGEQSF